MSLLDNLPHRCTLYRRYRTSDSMGGARPSRIPIREGIPCWQQPMSATEQTKYGKAGMSITTKIYFNSDPGIKDNDELVITHRRVAGVLTSIDEADWVYIENLMAHQPDRSAGLGLLFMAVGNDEPGAGT